MKSNYPPEPPLAPGPNVHRSPAASVTAAKLQDGAPQDWNTSAASGADGELYAGRTLPKRPRRSTTHRTNSPTDVEALEANKRTLCCRESRRTIIPRSSLIRHFCKRKRLCETIETAIRGPSEPYLPPMPRASPASLEVLQTRCGSTTTCNNAACKSISLSRCTRSHDYDFFPMSHWPTSPTETVSYALVRTSQLSKSSILIEVPQKQLGLQAAISSLYRLTHRV